jgi:hypothetical protein
MSLTVANVGGTLTGGASVVLSSAGVTGSGKSSFTMPDHTRLTPRVVDFYVTPVKSSKSDPGVARSGLKISLGDHEVVEGCCTNKQGSIIIDVGLRWSLEQPDTLIDTAIELLQALATADGVLADTLRKGALPT